MGQAVSKQHHYKFPMVSVTVDCCIFGWDTDGLHVLLIERGEEPDEGQWALPGGFLRSGKEDLLSAARRELVEETGVRVSYLEQLGTYGDPNRDPRPEHIITVAYIALVKRIDHSPQGGTDARTADWIPIDKSRRMQLAFDHNTILADATNRLYGKLRYDPLGFKLLPNKFPLRDVQRLYETAMGHEVDKRNFRKKLLEMGLLEDTRETETDVRHRAARLYRFNWKAYKQRQEEGWEFEI
jgi:8-oxo-dGTP diphosphatase